MASPGTEQRKGKRAVNQLALKQKGPRNRTDSSTKPPVVKSRFGHERMSRLGTALASDAMIVFMLSVVVVEATALIVWHRTTSRGPEPVELLSFLGAGASLMCAMFFVKRIKRSALPFATALLSALAFHIWHMSLLWGR